MDDLPDLPGPYWHLFTADQMHAYARVAIASRDAEIARLREALQQISNYARRDGDIIAQHLGGIAAAALKEKP